MKKSIALSDVWVRLGAPDQRDWMYDEERDHMVPPGWVRLHPEAG